VKIHHIVNKPPKIPGIGKTGRGARVGAGETGIWELGDHVCQLCVS